tara:strand:+ start:1451 stop:1882 length:432 start_codon:yes stop_codon:yes gene_type:complete
MNNNIIILSGGFDPIHKGHVRMFKEANKLGKVIVGLNSDKWLIRKKNKFFMPFDERKEILESIKYIDLVFDFNDDDDTACNLIKYIYNKFSKDSNVFFGNGGDRTNETTPEVQYCIKNNIELIWGLGGGKIQSSSDLLSKWED